MRFVLRSLFLLIFTFLLLVVLVLEAGFPLCRWTEGQWHASLLLPLVVGASAQRTSSWIRVPAVSSTYMLPNTTLPSATGLQPRCFSSGFSLYYDSTSHLVLVSGDYGSPSSLFDLLGWATESNT